MLMEKLILICVPALNILKCTILVEVGGKKHMLTCVCVCIYTYTHILSTHVYTHTHIYTHTIYNIYTWSHTHI